MDQVKIGKFIAACRKKENLTQMQLAEKLNITDRAVSKWERGISMPDSSVMLELCDILKISVNDLLCGEVVQMENYNKQMETRLMEMVREKEQADRRMLRLEAVSAALCLVPLIGAIAVVLAVAMEEWVATVVVLASIVPMLIALPFMLKIEQTAGYYRCAKCGHCYVPTYKSVFRAMHLHTTRYMKCPACGKSSWQKKVLHKD